MKNFLIFISISLFILISANSYAYSIDDLLKELDVPNWREKITESSFLEKFKSPEKFKTVVELADARGYDWRYRIRAIRMLGYMKTPQAKEALLGMFQDHFFHHECPSLKSYVAESLGDFPPGKRLMEILKEGLKDPEVLVRESTAKSLGRLKMPESVRYLTEAFRTEKSLAVKIAIINALKSIASPEAQSFIKQIASDLNNKELLDAFGGSL
ncbi:MAG: HEAT repeat domain-containing protein [Thermodesulfovibrio sp.]|nr:HEAT repeat domain-containing protein [Thermodesulfovibrio sp.]